MAIKLELWTRSRFESYLRVLSNRSQLNLLVVGIIRREWSGEGTGDYRDLRNMNIWGVPERESLPKRWEHWPSVLRNWGMAEHSQSLLCLLWSPPSVEEDGEHMTGVQDARTHKACLYISSLTHQCHDDWGCQPPKQGGGRGGVGGQGNVNKEHEERRFGVGKGHHWL